MIEADLKRKTNFPEDILTSNCLGLLALMDDCYLIDFFSTAIEMGGKNLNLSEYNSVKSIDFWPRLQGKEPDIIIVLESSATGQQIVLIIEVKHGSGKSGTSGGRDGAATTDQLAKYWLSARKTYPKNNLVIVYLTHHRSLPKQEITESIKKAGNGTLIYWTSWFKFQVYISDRCRDNKKTRIRWCKRKKCGEKL